MRFLPRFLRGDDDELGWDDLVRKVVKALVPLARYGARGRIAFPPDVLVTIEVAEGGVEVIRRFVADPSFDAEIGTRLANECDCATTELPEREYVVARGEATRVRATEGPRRVWEVRIEGGDRSGEMLPLPRERSEIRFGRGPFHGADDHVRNDLVVCHASEFVSRRAGRLVVSATRVDVQSLDQGDSLLVQRTSGESIRPSRTARGVVAMASGDAIDIVDGRGGAIRLVLERKKVEEASRGSDHP